MKMKLFVMCVVLYLASFANADYRDVTWNGGIGLWMVQENWTDVSPTADWAIPGWIGNETDGWNTYNTDHSTAIDWNKGRAIITSGTAQITPDSHPDGQIDRFYLGGSGTGGANLEISTDVKIWSGWISNVAGYSGTVTHTAGNVIIGGDASFGDKGTGVYNLSGGSLAINNAVTFGYTGGGVMNFNQTGGSFSAGGTAKDFILGQNYNTSGRSSGTVTVNNNNGTSSFSTNVNNLVIGQYANGTINLEAGTMSLGAVNTYLGRYAEGVGKINVSGGNLTMTTSGDDGIQIGRYGSGEINQTAGSINVTAGNIGLGRYADSTGKVNVSRGTFSQSDSAKKIVIGEYGTGTFVQSGSADVSFERLEIGKYDGSNGTYTISGGELDVSRYIYGKCSVFEVVGSNADHIITKKFEIPFSSAKLLIELDALGSSLIEVIGTTSDSYYGALLAGSTLEVDTLTGFDGIAGDVYDILWSATTIDTTNLVFSNLSDTQFSWAVVDDKTLGGQMLQLTVIPEPATIVLLTSGCLLFARRRF